MMARQIFQYPQSDRIVCNRGAGNAAGSGAGDFQYPQSDRIVCNFWMLRVQRDDVLLSVSAIGSNRLQLLCLLFCVR